MATVVSSTDSPESIKASFTGKGTVTVSDDAGNDITPKDAPTGDTSLAAATDKEAGTSVDSATAGDTTKDQPSKADKRIDKLTKELSEARQKLAAATAEPAPKSGKVADVSSVDDEPKPENFDSQADFLKALSKWSIKESRKEELAEAAKQTEVQEKQKTLDNWHEQQKTAREKYKDYDEVMTDEIIIGVAAAKTLVELPDGVELAYYVGKHPEEAAALAKLTKERDVAIALGELRAKVKVATPKPQVAAKEKPKPITPVTGLSKGSIDKPRSELSYKEYKAVRQQEIAARRKA